MKHKDEEFDKFNIFKELVENELDLKIKCIRSNQGGEYMLDEFFDLCEQHGIKRQFSIARSPKKTSVMERMSRIVEQMACTILDEYRTPDTF